MNIVYNNIADFYLTSNHTKKILVKYRFTLHIGFLGRINFLRVLDLSDDVVVVESIKYF